MNVAATITLTPGTVISRLTSGHDSASAAISRSTCGDLAVEELDLAHGRVDGLALGERQLLLGQPAAALDAEQIRRRRAVLQAAHQHRVDLVLRARARPHELRPAREPPAHRADALIGRPHPVELARPQQLRQRARVEAIGLRARLADPGVARRDDDHARHVRLEDPRDRPRIARHLQRDPVARVEALREQLERLGPRLRSGPAERSRPSATIATSQKSRWTSSATALTSPPRCRRQAGEPVGKRHRRIRARSATGQVAGAATEKPGLEAHRPKRPAQPAFSQKAPRPSRPNLSRPPDTTRPSGAQFHAPNTSGAGRDAGEGTQSASDSS